MLPWRRSKFVLVEDEAKTKAKSLGSAGLTYHSIFSSLLRSCPDLLPDFPLDWVGSLFQTKRQKVELNKEEPVYSVRYLGSVVTIAAKGDGCTREAVDKIWTRSNYGEQSLKMRLTVGLQGLRMSPDKKRKPTHLYSLHRITCCAADPGRPKILAWVYRHQVKNMAVVLRCHAVLLSRSEKARGVARSLDHHAAAAFGEFKRLKRQSDFRRRQQQLLGDAAVPLMPLRRLLNGQCHYRPPAHSPAGSTTRLSPITEEEEEEEEEEEKEEEEEEEEEEDREEGKVEEEKQDPKEEEDARKRRGRPEKQRVLTTSTDPTQLLSELALGDIAGLEECQINFINDSNNNTFTFITSLV
ncbi:hypothetical protein NHX12_012364 [Muraenolepis orangiensis]|uniref:PID domain-containing protein n=1 Tax=Muraenolepis orangiensis TaxID=630683 RepID=A0A9Q0I5U4_9TELE|nr:hypothetical protein NHX12_012364 [Muraenolepis orangiensis]